MPAIVCTSLRVNATNFSMSPIRRFCTNKSSVGSASKYFTVGITGSSGMVGSALIDQLGKVEAVDGKPVRIVKMIRSKSVEESTGGFEEGNGAALLSLPWNPEGESTESTVDPEALEQMDAIVHLAGENVATGLGPLGFLGIRPWSEEKKAMILGSRVGATERLSKAIAACPTPTTFISASGIGAYGSDFIDGSSPSIAAADESMDISATKGFLSDISRKWETATVSARDKNRVVNARFGVILSKQGGALSKLYPIFYVGGGGVVGSGKQFFSFMSARDAARALVHSLETPALKGPVNFCAPNPCTNSEFTSAFGKVLSRPTIFPLPGFMVSLMFGEMGDEMLLGGTKAVPTRLIESGFLFDHPTISDALKSAVEETI